MRITIHGVPKDTAERFLLDPQGGVWHLCRAADLPGTWQVSPGAACETPCEAIGLAPVPVVAVVAPTEAPEMVATSEAKEPPKEAPSEPQAKEGAGRGSFKGVFATVSAEMLKSVGVVGEIERKLMEPEPPPEFMAGFVEEKAEEPAPVKPTHKKAHK